MASAIAKQNDEICALKRDKESLRIKVCCSSINIKFTFWCLCSMKRWKERLKHQFRLTLKYWKNTKTINCSNKVRYKGPSISSSFINIKSYFNKIAQKDISRIHSQKTFCLLVKQGDVALLDECETCTLWACRFHVFISVLRKLSVENTRLYKWFLSIIVDAESRSPE